MHFDKYVPYGSGWENDSDRFFKVQKSVFTRFFFLTFIFSVLLMFALDTVAMAEGVIWTLRQTTRLDSGAESPDSENLQITITDQETEIYSSREILFLDYRDMYLYRLNRLSGQCSVFDLKRAEPNGAAKQTVSLLSEFLVKESSERREIKGLHCDKKTVLSGAGLFRLRTFVPKVLKRYGQSFSEAVAEYWISQDVANLEVLKSFVQQRQTIFAEQTLLQRIDPLGLVAAVGGFPVQGWQKSSGVKVFFTLVNGPETGTFVLRPPQECANDSEENDVM